MDLAGLLHGKHVEDTTWSRDCPPRPPQLLLWGQDHWTWSQVTFHNAITSHDRGAFLKRVWGHQPGTHTLVHQRVN